MAGADAVIQIDQRNQHPDSEWVIGPTHVMGTEEGKGKDRHRDEEETEQDGQQPAQ